MSKNYNVVSAWIEQRRIKYQLNDGSLRWGPDAQELCGFTANSITYIANGHIQMIEINTSTGGFGSNKFIGRAPSKAPNMSTPTNSSNTQDFELTNSNVSTGGSLFFLWLRTVLRFLWKPQSSDIKTQLVGGISVAIICGIGYFGLQGFNSVSNFVSNLTGGSFFSESSPRTEPKKSEPKKIVIDEDAVINVVSGYINGTLSAVQNGNFKEASSYWAERNEIYNKQKQNAENLYKSGITKEAVDLLIEKIVTSQTAVKVYMYEKYKITYGDRGYKYSDNFYVYYLQNHAPYKIFDLQSSKNLYAKSQKDAVVTKDTQLYTNPFGENMRLITDIKRNDKLKVYTGQTATKNNKVWIRVSHAKYGLGWVDKNTIKLPEQKPVAKEVRQTKKTTAQPQQKQKPSTQTSSSSTKSVSKPKLTDEERRYQELLQQYNLAPGDDNATATSSIKQPSGQKHPTQTEEDTIRRGVVSGVNSINVYAQPVPSGSPVVGFVQKGDTFNVYTQDIRADIQGTKWIRIGHPNFGQGWVYANYIKIIN